MMAGYESPGSGGLLASTLAIRCYSGSTPCLAGGAERDPLAVYRRTAIYRFAEYYWRTARCIILDIHVEHLPLLMWYVPIVFITALLFAAGLRRINYGRGLSP